MSQPPVEPDYNLLYYWRIVARAKWVILAIVSTALILTAIYTVMQPKLYEAKAVLLPAREEAMSGGGLSMGGGGRGGGGGSAGGGGGASMAMEALGGKGGSAVLDSLTAILVSRTMAEAVANDLNLAQYYGVSSLRAAAAAVRREMEPKSTKYKSLEIVVTSKEPNMAAQIANTYATMLDRMNKNLTITATKRVRQYIEGRLAERTQSLAAAEDTIRKFQDENRVRVTSTEGGEGGQQGDVAVIGGLVSQIMGLEVELAALKQYAQANHPLVNQLEAQIREMRRQVDRVELERVRGGDGGNKKRLVPMSKKLYPSFEETTAMNFEVQTLARRLKVEEAVYGSLVGMLESAKLAEAKDLPTVQLLDAALPPEGPSKPNMLYNLTAAAGLSLVFGILLAIFLDYLDWLRAQERALAQVTAVGVAPTVVDSNGNGLETAKCLMPQSELVGSNGNELENAGYPISPKESERIRD